MLVRAAAIASSHAATYRHIDIISRCLPASRNVWRGPCMPRERRMHVDLRIATYNIHRCRGLDRRVIPSRTADVIAEIGADVVALQEVIGADASHPGHAEELGAALGMGWVMAPARRLRGHLFGNVVLSRLPIREHSQYDLTWDGREPRCCQRVDLAVDDHTVHLYNVHLGTSLRERRHQ